MALLSGAKVQAAVASWRAKQVLTGVLDGKHCFASRGICICLYLLYFHPYKTGHPNKTGLCKLEMVVMLM